VHVNTKSSEILVSKNDDKEVIEQPYARLQQMIRMASHEFADGFERECSMKAFL